MQQWCAQIEDEISSWPEVTSRPMFGMCAFYRRKRIFAAVPRTRAAVTPNSLLLKLPESRDKRLARGGPGAKWVTFAIESGSDLPTALRWLSRAYQVAHTRRAGRRREQV